MTQKRIVNPPETEDHDDEILVQEDHEIVVDNDRLTPRNKRAEDAEADLVGIGGAERCFV